MTRRDPPQGIGDKDRVPRLAACMRRHQTATRVMRVHIREEV
jgi:hypothetical protein